MFTLRIYSSVLVLSVVCLMMIHSAALPVDHDNNSDKIVSGLTKWNLKDQMTNTIIFENWLLSLSNKSSGQSEFHHEHHISKRFVNPIAFFILLFSFFWRLFGLLMLIPQILFIFL